MVYKDLLAAPESANGDVNGKGDEPQDSDGEGVALDDDASGNDSESSSDEAHQPRGKRFQDKDEKKAHKQKVKEEKREKRLTKMPKYVKNKLVKEKSRTKR